MLTEDPAGAKRSAGGDAPLPPLVTGAPGEDSPSDPGPDGAHRGSKGTSAGRGWLFRTLLLPSLLLATVGLAAALHERPNVPDYGRLIFRQLFARHEPAGVLLQLALLLLAWPLGRALRHPSPLLSGIARRALPIAALYGAVLAAGALLVYDAHPLSMDEYAATFQARVFAAGRLTGQFPPELLPRLIPVGFLLWFLTPSLATGEVVSSYWPGFALLLTPFMAAGVPWLLNPLLGAGCGLLLCRLARRWIGDDASAGWALLFALSSPAVTVNAISFYSMTAHLFLNLLWMVLVTEGNAGVGDGVRLSGRLGRLLLAGLVGSLALVLHTPLPHALFALPWLFAILRRRGVRALLALGLGYLPAALVGAAWLQLRGSLSAWSQPGGAALPLVDRLRGLTRGLFVLPDGALLWDRFLASVELTSWSAPFLVVLAACGVLIARRGSPLRLLALSALVTFAVYSLIPFNQGHGWGDRYFHPVWAVLPLLAAAALADPRAGAWRRPVLAAALAAVLAANALRLWQVDGFVERHLAQVPPLPAEGRAVCFLSPRGGSYVSDLYQNDPFLRNRVWMLISYGAERDAELMRARFPGSRQVAAYPNATVWRIP